MTNSAFFEKLWSSTLYETSFLHHPKSAWLDPVDVTMLLLLFSQSTPSYHSIAHCRCFSRQSDSTSILAGQCTLPDTSLGLQRWHRSIGSPSATRGTQHTVLRPSSVLWCANVTSVTAALPLPFRNREFGTFVFSFCSESKFLFSKGIFSRKGHEKEKEEALALLWVPL